GPSTAADKQLTATPMGPALEQVAVGGNANVIPDGLLYTCQFNIDVTAATGMQPLSNVAGATDPAGGVLLTNGSAGQIIVTTCTGDCDGSTMVTIGEVIRC